ncbi:hypothetical protein [Pantoea piersonii]|uniref:hypothetical protein n=1 Tax=Pantoea piersonii TaxID=2364647 RepID=UPI0028A996D1|nr:hypothetical protein [Pantoea piersonii]
MKWLAIIILLLPLAQCVANSHDDDIEQIAYKKIKMAIQRNNSNDITLSEYDDVLNYISKGKPQWISLYPELIKLPFLGVASFQEGLHISMAYALAENPAEVLKFVNINNVDDICGAPFIEPTQQDLNSYFIKARAALMATSSNNTWRSKCLMTLDREMKTKSALAGE